MARDALQLSFAVADLADDAVGVFDRDVEEIALAGGLPVGHGALDHLAEVIAFVAAALHLGPALGADPGVRVPGVHLAGGIEIAIGLLGRRHQHQHAVDIGLQRSVRIGLQEVAGAFDRLVDVGVVEREAAHAVRGIGLRGAHEVVVAPRLLAFAESERDGHFAAGLQALAPEGVGDLDVGERHLADRVARLRRVLPAGERRERGDNQENGFRHR